jgi:hypothetical protein
MFYLNRLRDLYGAAYELTFYIEILHILKQFSILMLTYVKLWCLTYFFFFIVKWITTHIGYSMGDIQLGRTLLRVSS